MTYSFDELIKLALEITEETIRRGDGCIVVECLDCKSCDGIFIWTNKTLYKHYLEGCNKCQKHNLLVRISNEKEQGLLT
jgi:hypothetical protein